MPSRPLLILTLLALFCGACGATAADPTESTPALSSLPAVEADPPTTRVTSPTSAVTSTSNTTTTTSAPHATALTTLVQGGPSEFGPREGDVLAVIGVRYDDTLNLRAGPGVHEEVLGRIDPTYEGLVARGETWQLPAGLWVRVGYESLTGWVNLRFVAHAGTTDDVTPMVVAALGGYPVASSMEDLGRMAAEIFAVSEPSSVLVMSVAPTSGDRPAVAFDVVGIGDDAVAGVRVHVAAVETEKGFALDTVEAMEFCARGATPEGLCV